MLNKIKDFALRPRRVSLLELLLGMGTAYCLAPRVPLWVFLPVWLAWIASSWVSRRFGPPDQQAADARLLARTVVGCDIAMHRDEAYRQTREMLRHARPAADRVLGERS